MKLIASIALLAVAGSVSAAPDLGYAEAKTLADKDEASLVQPESSDLLKAQGALLGAGAAACASPNPDLSPFVVVMELDGQGRIVRTWLQAARR